MLQPLEREMMMETDRIEWPGQKSQWQGFDRYDFTVDGCPCLVVPPPAAPAPGRPWMWQAEFFGHRPETDVAMLQRGYHVVYIDVGNTFGCPDALLHWDAFYAFLTQRGLSARPSFEGVSRGGLYAYNWVARHPHCVSCIIGDNPVCDFKSWPAGKGVGPGNPTDWVNLKRFYHFATDAEALAYGGNPVDNLRPLAEAGVPLLHICGDADEVVPYEENTVVLRKRYEELGGSIQVIVKKGFKHHPHGLDDPTPIVEFILRHTRNQ